MDERAWPEVGDRLVHKFRKQPGEIVAEVISVDREAVNVKVEVNGKIYPSLSAAASAMTGHAANGWVYWGLKKQKPRLEKYPTEPISEQELRHRS